MLFSIVTPSYNQLQWLRVCIASVQDQIADSTLNSSLSMLSIEHIIQDAGTPGIDQLALELGAEFYCDGQLVFGKQNEARDKGRETSRQHSQPNNEEQPVYSLKIFSEKDAGMYDAVNRGFKKGKGDVLAYLNCDEQYLPNSLAAVQDFFRARPSVEVALAGTIVTNADGNYVCHRHSLVPNKQQMWYRFPVLTSSIFLRRSVVYDRGIHFDTKWRDLGDFHFILALVKKNVRMAVCECFTSVFADTGENMNLKPNAILEKEQTAKMVPFQVRMLKPLWIVFHRIRRLLAGHFYIKPTSYSIYTKNNVRCRLTFEVPKPTGIWWNRL